MATQSHSMEPLSVRIPSDLYLWLAQLQVEGATTNSDKLRVLLGQLKRQHDGALDYVAANTWARDLTGRLRDALVRVEGRSGRHSEVLNLILDHLTTSLALVVSQVPEDEAGAARIEEALVRRALALGEALLRQATTAAAAAFDPAVIRRHIAATIELASTIPGIVSNARGA
ncbi:hypothetical protein [Nevskia sp.]|uniref:hypothetical protein n=1 Tax=Nevskia sp. TaxID=1929292 RepID=UPI0025D35963|nr:hypothetical protein [Nevskia sp.]